jgi:hypothetical protein
MAADTASPLCYATATELARRIRDRETSSTAITEAYLARIAAHNGSPNAIVHLFEAEARSRANEPRVPRLTIRLARDAPESTVSMRWAGGRQRSQDASRLRSASVGSGIVSMRFSRWRSIPETYHATHKPRNVLRRNKGPVS